MKSLKTQIVLGWWNKLTLKQKKRLTHKHVDMFKPYDLLTTREIKFIFEKQK